jgi:ParB-like chromosome segregation protein Spo0J
MSDRPLPSSNASPAARAGAGLVEAKTIEIDLDDIAIPPSRMRQLRPEKVDELTESIRMRGHLLHPIAVRPRDVTGYILVAGWHRLEAVRKLGWPAIRATVLDGLDADAAQLVEIDENLIHVDLTVTERAMHMARRKELYEKLHPETQVGATGRRRSKVRQVGEANDRFTKDAAKKIGRSERDVQRDVTRANKVVVLSEIAGTCLDKGNEIDALAKLPPEQQRALAEAAKRGETVSAKSPSRIESEPEPKSEQQIISDEARKATYAAEEQQPDAVCAETDVTPSVADPQLTEVAASIRQALDAIIKATDTLVSFNALAETELKAAHDQFETDDAFNTWLVENKLAESGRLRVLLTIAKHSDLAVSVSMFTSEDEPIDMQTATKNQASKRERSRQATLADTFENAVFCACSACDSIREMKVPAIPSKIRAELTVSLYAAAITLLKLQTGIPHPSLSTATTPR